MSYPQFENPDHAVVAEAAEMFECPEKLLRYAVLNKRVPKVGEHDGEPVVHLGAVEAWNDLRFGETVFLWREGWSVYEIASRLGIATRSVEQALRRAGVLRRGVKL